jgi:hypothetical protein
LRANPDAASIARIVDCHLCMGVKAEFIAPPEPED